MHTYFTITGYHSAYKSQMRSITMQGYKENAKIITLQMTKTLGRTHIALNTEMSIRVVTTEIYFIICTNNIASVIIFLTSTPTCNLVNLHI